MDEILEGVSRFQDGLFSQMKPIYEKLKDGQQPRALIFSCSDSRIVPDVVINTMPGTLFTVRNVGNLVPGSGSEASEGAAIEYAVKHLKVANIIVMGHSSCGAMNAALAGRNKLDDDHLKNWLKFSDESLARLPEEATADDLSRLNARIQVKQLLTYDCVKKAVDAGELKLHAWWYDFVNGKVMRWNESKEEYEKVTKDKV